jgi:transposase
MTDMTAAVAKALAEQAEKASQRTPSPVEEALAEQGARLRALREQQTQNGAIR